MHIPSTIAALMLQTAAMLLLRIFWMRIDVRLRFFLIRGSIGIIALHAFFAVSKWGTSSSYINVIINWLAIAGYELLVFLFSRLSPKWLTTLSAVILIAPLFASSILLPLTRLFEPNAIPRVPIGNHLYYKVAPWSVGGAANSGVDLDILYSPPFAPFLSHKLQTQPFNTQECNAFASFALLGPSPRTVIARCPRWPSESSGVEDKLLKLH
jgi:hypothetical protein